MATIVHMPEVLAGVTEAAVGTWLVEVGQRVVVGSPLAEIETDKAVVEYAAEVDGVILEVLVAAGAPVAIGEAILVIGAEGEQLPVPEEEVRRPSDAPEESHRGNATSAGGTAVAVSPEPSVEQPGRALRLMASPLVRRLARERGLDLRAIVGSGPRGRIVRRDLDGLPSPSGAAPVRSTAGADVSAPPAAEGQAGFDDVPVTPMRRAIARRLTESTNTVPHFFVEADCRVDELIELRRRINEQSDLRVSLNDFVIRAVAGALLEVPEANAIWQETTIRRFRSADIAVAVAVEGGLVTPVLRGVERLSLGETSAALADLVDRARAGRLRQHEIEGGAFSVSNLGMFGVEAFSAIINPPHSGILAVGAARTVPVVAEGEIRVGAVMTVTLSADHRVVDGAVAARWLAAFVRRIENPLSMLV